MIITSTYVTIHEANDYFSTKLDMESWDESNDTDKLKALIQATRIIDRLNFKGSKSTIDQELEFPRLFDNINDSNNDIIPDDIKIACLEIAFSLLDGVDTEEEIKNLYTDSKSYVNTKVTYNRTYIPEYYQAGVPSALAWQHLIPYLTKSKTIDINRV